MRPAMLLVMLLLAVPARAGRMPDATGSSIVRWDFAPRLVWSVDRAAGQAFANPGELRVMDDGTCVFHDFERNLSQIFTPGGRHVCEFAAQGTQPGQVSFYLNCFIAGDEIVIGAPTELYFFGKDGRLAASYPNNLFERFPIAFLGGRVALLAPGNPSAEPGAVTRIVRADFASGKESVFAELKTGAPGGKGSRGPSVVVRGLTPTIEAVWDGSAGRVYYGYTSDCVIKMARADGESVGVASLEKVRRPVDEAAKRRHSLESGLPAEHIDAIVAALPGELACFRGLWAEGGLLYVLPPTGLDRYVTEQPVQILSAAGRLLGEAGLRLPGGLRFSPDAAAIVGHDLFVLCLDAQDHWSLRRYAISIPRTGQDGMLRR